MNVHGIEYLNYDQTKVDAFMRRSRGQRVKRQLDAQLLTAERRGFSSTKIPLDTLRYLLSLIA